MFIEHDDTHWIDRGSYRTYPAFESIWATGYVNCIDRIGGLRQVMSRDSPPTATGYVSG